MTKPELRALAIQYRVPLWIIALSVYVGGLSAIAGTKALAAAAVVAGYALVLTLITVAARRYAHKLDEVLS